MPSQPQSNFFRSISTSTESKIPTSHKTLAARTSTAVDIASSVAALLHQGAAGRAQIGLIADHASGDGADIGNFAGAKTIDIGGAGAPLLGRALSCQRRAGRSQGDQQGEPCNASASKVVDPHSVQSFQGVT